MKVNSHKLNEADYPAELAQLYDPPKVIYWSGANPKSWLRQPKLAVVGSRKPTGYGRQITYSLSSQLAAAGAVIISGLAFGIDSIAHQAALDQNGITVAVLPGPLDNIYPASHRSIAERILKSGGCLISEYPSGTKIYKHSFIARNRIIAGLCDVLLVPQAATKSGSLHTANFALEQGKTVMAVPGEITLEGSRGVNNLLKNGALLVTEAKDIIEALGIKENTSSPKPLFKASPSQRQLYQLISQGIADQEDLGSLSGLGSAELASALSLLEIDGYIRVDAGQWSLN